MIEILLKRTLNRKSSIHPLSNSCIYSSVKNKYWCNTILTFHLHHCPILVGGAADSKLGVCGDSAGGTLAASTCHELHQLIQFAVG